MNTTVVKEDATPFMKVFSSKEEADLFNLTRDMQLSDMEKFRLFCRMIKIGRMLASAKVEK